MDLRRLGHCPDRRKRPGIPLRNRRLGRTTFFAIRLSRPEALGHCQRSRRSIVRLSARQMSRAMQQFAPLISVSECQRGPGQGGANGGVHPNKMYVDHPRCAFHLDIDTIGCRSGRSAQSLEAAPISHNHLCPPRICPALPAPYCGVLPEHEHAMFDCSCTSTPDKRDNYIF